MILTYTVVCASCLNTKEILKIKLKTYNECKPTMLLCENENKINKNLNTEQHSSATFFLPPPQTKSSKTSISLTHARINRRQYI